MEISINVKSDSDNSYTDNVKLVLEECNDLIYLKIDDGREREIAVDAKELGLAIQTLNANNCVFQMEEVMNNGKGF